MSTPFLCSLSKHFGLAATMSPFLPVLYQFSTSAHHQYSALDGFHVEIIFASRAVMWSLDPHLLSRGHSAWENSWSVTWSWSWSGRTPHVFQGNKYKHLWNYLWNLYETEIILVSIIHIWYIQNSLATFPKMRSSSWIWPEMFPIDQPLRLAKTNLKILQASNLAE